VSNLGFEGVHQSQRWSDLAPLRGCVKSPTSQLRSAESVLDREDVPYLVKSITVTPGGQSQGGR
jgi:hypothetical protein